VVTGGVLPGGKSMYSFGDVPRVELMQTGTHALAFHSDVCVFVAELVKELQGNVDAPEEGCIVSGHILEFVLATYLQVGQAERFLNAPHRLSNDNCNRDLEHARSDVGTGLVSGAASEVLDGSDLIGGEFERRPANWHIRSELHGAPRANDQLG
jgi:hypothetical protein